jgi:hypothetical protein
MTPEEIEQRILEFLYEEYKEDPRHMVKSSTLFSKMSLEDDKHFWDRLNFLLDNKYIQCIREYAKPAPLICNAKITEKGIKRITSKK